MNGLAEKAPASNQAAPLIVLSASGLSKRFVAGRSLFGRATAHVAAVDGVDLELRAGETLALVGESGCGKSTLGRLILRLIEPTGGTVRLDGEDITALAPAAVRARRRKMQLIFQDPYSSLNPRMTVADMLAEPLMLHDVVPAGQRQARVAELMRLVGLRPEQALRFPHEFSGGQRQRIVIARALAADPRLIVCDEAVSALDVSIRAQVLNLLADLQKKLGLAYLFISHDLSVVRHIADRVAVMYLGRIVETGAAEAVFGQPRHPYTRALLSAVPSPIPGRHSRRRPLQGDVPSPLNPPPGCHLNPRCAHAEERCRSERPALIDDGHGHGTACHFWPKLGADAGMDAGEAPANPRLDKLLAAFAAFDPPAASASAPETV